MTGCNSPLGTGVAFIDCKDPVGRGYIPEKCPAPGNKGCINGSPEDDASPAFRGSRLAADAVHAGHLSVWRQVRSGGVFSRSQKAVLRPQEVCAPDKRGAQVPGERHESCRREKRAPVHE